MALLFNETDQWYSITDSAALSLPDDDWCIGIWTRVTSLTGAISQYLISNNNFGVNNSVNIFINEASASADANKWKMQLVDGDGTATGSVSAFTETGADGLWRLIIVQRRSAEELGLQMWHCLPNASAVWEIGLDDTGFGAVNGGDWNIGRRVDGNVDRYYGNEAAEMFILSGISLSQAQIEALAAGQRPIIHLSDMALYLSMLASDANMVDQSGNGNTAFKNGVPSQANTHPYNSYFARGVI